MWIKRTLKQLIASDSVPQIGLQDIKPGDLFGVPPNGGFQRWCCDLEDCITFHWGFFVTPIPLSPVTPTDWVVSESILKGVAITRLDRRNVYVYRIKRVTAIDPSELIQFHSIYGSTLYNWQADFRTATWFIARHYLGKVLPVINKGNGYNCIEWDVLMAQYLGYTLCPSNQYVTEETLENNPFLDLVGVVNTPVKVHGRVKEAAWHRYYKYLVSNYPLGAT